LLLLSGETAISDLEKWLEGLGLSEYAKVFTKNNIGFDVLTDLTDEHLIELGMSLGDRLRLLKAVENIMVTQTSVPEIHPTSDPTLGEADRRQLTVMFCDLVGSTSLSEQMDPEDLRSVIGTFQQACANVIAFYDGYIARYMGDGLLVYFGYPQAHEDDPERAVRAGLGIVEAVENLEPGYNIDLKVRVGIATGLVVAGDIVGEGASEERVVLGETPNLAARLQGLAEPNSVVVGDSTWQLVEGLFICDALGPKSLKGISEAVEPYRIRAETGAPSRFEASAKKGLTPLVGREAEIGLLLKRWDQAKEGEDQVVLLSGESGIGKSRIVRDFRKHLVSQSHNRVLYYGSPYHSNTMFYPVIDQIKRGLRFEKNDDPRQKLEKLEAVLGNLGLSIAEHAPPLAALLSLPTGDRYSLLPVSPDEVKKQILKAVIHTIVAMAAQQPVLVVVEDAHWIDPSTLELMGLLIEQLRTNRILLLITFRPEFIPPWRGHGNITALALNRLSHRETTEMIEQVSGGKALPEVLLKEIIERTDGVPIFVEELTKTVLELDQLEVSEDSYVLTGPFQSHAIPASLQDSLMARLDRLAPVRDVAQLAATIGRSFDYELLLSVSNLDDDALQEALSLLVDVELIYYRGIDPEKTYEFKHALVRDTAYQSLLNSTRQQYHQRIACSLEEHFPAKTESEPELIAWHYTEAGLVEDALNYWLKAGEHAAGICANAEAVGHLTKGLEMLAEMEDSPERRQRELALLIAIGVPLRLTTGVSSEKVGEVYKRARVLCKEVGKPAELYAVLWGLWAFYRGLSDFEHTRRLAEEIVDLARGENDSGLLLQAHHAQWTTLLYLGDWSNGLEHAQQGMSLYQEDQHHGMSAVYGGHDAGVCALGLGAMFLWLLGRSEEAWETSRKAVALGQHLPHAGSRIHAFEFASVLRQFRREPDEVLKYCEEAQDIAEVAGIARHVAAANLFRAWALATQRHSDRTLPSVDENLFLLRKTGFALPAPYFLAVAADTYKMEGQPDKGLDLIAEGLRIVEETGIFFWEPELHRLRGDLLLADARQDEAAEASYQRAIDAGQRQGALPLELRAVTALARMWSKQSKRREAQKLLQPVYARFTEGFETTDLREAKVLLDELS
jgi:class 3 adenylate cyclase/predicted ATPase